MTPTFEDLGLSKEILKSIEDMGFEEPSPIQSLTIPYLMEGRNIVGQAQTGTGKTAAFGIPILENTDARSKATQALVLCPTRELAIQVAEEIGNLASRRKGIFVLPIYGGQPIDRQFRSLERGAQIIVGTPGRVIDHLTRGTLQLSKVRTAVLDEADEMLDMGFREDIEEILRQIPEDAQRVLFSATMPPPIMEITRKFLNNPEILKVTPKVVTVPSIEQVYYEVRPYQKMDALCRVLDSQGFRKALVFCSTKRAVDEVTVHLQARGYQADGLHGNLVQQQRDRVMGRFRSGGIEILVATDVAARGIDVEDVDAVINYDIPNDVENYVHRIGRTGRAGREGKAFTFVTGREHYRLRDIMRYTNAKIANNRLPTLRDVATIKITRLMDEAREVMNSGALERHVAIVEQFMEEDRTSMDMAAALLKLLMQREFGVDDPSNANHDKDDPLAQDNNDRKQFRREREGKPNHLRGERQQRAASKFGPRRFAGKARLFFNVGSKLKVEPRDLVGAIAGETGISGRNIGAIEIHDKHSFVDVPSDMADQIISIMNSSQIRGFRVSVKRADKNEK